MRAAIKPSFRISALAYAISLWIEGTAQLRDSHNSSLLFMAIGGQPSPPSEQPQTPQYRGGQEGATVTRRVLNWLLRSGKELGEGEKTVLGFVQVFTSLTILRSIGFRPLLPFLVAPFISSLDIPPSIRKGPVKWTYMILSSVGFTLLYEAKKVIVLQLIKTWKRKMKPHDPDLGNVSIQGAIGPLVAPQSQVDTPSPSSSNPYEAHTNGEYDEHLLDYEDEDECLICSGLGIDNPMAQSVSSLTSMMTQEPDTETDLSFLHPSGPLEGFCTTAPDKHLLHKACFLRWMEEHQRQRGVLDSIEVRRGWSSTARYNPPLAYPSYEDEWVDESDLRRGRLILQKSGLGYLANQLRLPALTLEGERILSLVLNGFSVPPSQVFTLSAPPASQASTPTNHIPCLATLRTSSPPCPACRSPVELRFVSEIPRRLAGRLRTRSSRARQIWQSILRDWHRYVTGRTLGMKLLSQLSLVLAILSFSQNQRWRSPTQKAKIH